MCLKGGKPQSDDGSRTRLDSMMDHHDENADEAQGLQDSSSCPAHASSAPRNDAAGEARAWAPPSKSGARGTKADSSGLSSAVESKPPESKPPRAREEAGGEKVEERDRLGPRTQKSSSGAWSRLCDGRDADAHQPAEPSTARQLAEHGSRSRKRWTLGTAKIPPVGPG